MSILRRYRLLLAVLAALMVVIVAFTFFRRDTINLQHAFGDPSMIVRGGRRADADVVADQRRNGELLRPSVVDSIPGLIPSYFFTRTSTVKPSPSEEDSDSHLGGDTPHNLLDRVEDVIMSKQPKEELPVLSQPEQRSHNNDTTKSLNKGDNKEFTEQKHRSTDKVEVKYKIPLVLEGQVGDTFPFPKHDRPQPEGGTLSSPSSISDGTATSFSPPSVALSTMPPFRPSKELFVRAVHFDDRPRNGHRNTSVFLVVALRTITDQNLIVGCQIDDNIAKDFKVDLIGETPLWRAFYNHINHEEAMVLCYDLPATRESTGYISYRLSVNSTVKIATSERPVRFPVPRIPPTSDEGIKYNLTIVACAKIFNSPPWLGEWITYMKTLGIDHIHFDAEDSFKKFGAFKNSVLQEAIQSGFVTVEIWKQYLNGNELWYHNQGLIYEDCAYRYRNTYDYIVMVDTDDFFTPRVPGQGKLHYYVDKYCRGQTTGSCKFKWIEYFPDYYGLNNKTTNDGNITSRLANFSHYTQGNPKSVHRTNVVFDAATHYAYKMVKGFNTVQVSPNVAYFAHIRKNKNPPSMGKGLKVGVPHSSACLGHVLSRNLLVFLLMLCILCRV